MILSRLKQLIIVRKFCNNISRVTFRVVVHDAIAVAIHWGTAEFKTKEKTMAAKKKTAKKKAAKTKKKAAKKAKKPAKKKVAKKK